jgi:hypothetical protein
VKRVIITASCASIQTGEPVPTIYEETSWNEPAIKEVKEKGAGAGPLMIYRASKAIAEKGTLGHPDRNNAIAEVVIL